MKRYIKSSIEDNFRDSCLAIQDVIEQTYENYSNYCSDDEMYRIADDRISDVCEPTSIDIWQSIKGYVESDYTVEDIYNMTSEQAANLFKLLYMVHSNDTNK